MAAKTYDLLVIGSGPGGEKAAIQAAKLGKTVLVVEKNLPGGGCLHTGTIPSKTLRESVRYIALTRQRAIYGINIVLDHDLSIDRLMHRRRATTLSLTDRLERNLERNKVDYLNGVASFEDPHTLRVNLAGGAGTEEIRAEHIIIATGSSPYRPEWLDFSNPRVLDADTILGLHQVPKTLTIIGAGVIACEYATIFSNLGVKVNLVNPRMTVLDFLDLEIANMLTYLMREAGIRLRLGETLTGVEHDSENVYAQMESGKALKSDYLLFANGRTGNTRELCLDKAGLTVNKRHQLEVNTQFQTAVPHIYAVGDVIGFPALAATAMHQGRLAALHACGKPVDNPGFNLIPTGIYTIPEISTVGATEEDLTRAKIPYEVGAATYKELARGQIMGTTTGRMKLLFHRDTLKLLGVHILGDYATDLIHIGQAVMAHEGTIEYFIDSVYNYPTFSEGYRVAALNGINRL
ncbi:MAG: Si-specific NAD(P)(+) transhydrogenase [Deltaproteobacteria bacterium]|nr:Si-specific NAD(P)(+) transhydrogenase [Deltaproteobacteria bacterium]